MDDKRLKSHHRLIRTIICDEAVSALDVSVRAQMLNLLVDGTDGERR